MLISIMCNKGSGNGAQKKETLSPRKDLGLSKGFSAYFTTSLDIGSLKYTWQCQHTLTCQQLWAMEHYFPETASYGF